MSNKEKGLLLKRVMRHMKAQQCRSEEYVYMTEPQIWAMARKAIRTAFSEARAVQKVGEA